MITLPVLDGPATVPADLSSFASEEKPLRPSRTAKFGGCPMSIVLTMWSEERSGKAADTGNIVHAAVKAFHDNQGPGRVAAAHDALAAARLKFREGDPTRARTIFDAYAADPQNAEAEVLWCEQQVTLRLKAAPEDPTGKPVVIIGTLDQVRRVKGKKKVYDLKTGSAKDAQETLDEYMIQQAVYTLAARDSLDPEIMPGEIIYTPGYEKARGKVFLPLKMDIDLCNILVTPLVHWVALVRRGVPLFRPNASDCDFCPVKPWPKCRGVLRGAYGF